MFTRFLEWWSNASDQGRQSGQLKDYGARYGNDTIPPRYRWLSARLGVHRIFRSPSESYQCTECGCEVSRTLENDGIRLHEQWHWRVDRVTD